MYLYENCGLDFDASLIVIFFIVLRGYIDESYEGKSPIPSVFALGCLIGDEAVWKLFERDWLKCIDDVNLSLRAQDRPEITRFHASDCSSLEGEFRGWSPDEQKDFAAKLFQVFRRHRLDMIGVLVNLRDLVELSPEISPNPIGFAYVLMLQLLMLKIGDFTLSRAPDALISLFHDHCDYDAPLLESFNHLLSDPLFAYANRFTSITPMRWQHCVPLQPADLIAFEHFKEGERRLPESQRDRRFSLKVLLDLQSLGVHGVGYDRQTIGALKNVLDSLDPVTKAILLATARIT
jgi:hypothetical protein